MSGRKSVEKGWQVSREGERELIVKGGGRRQYALGCRYDNRQKRRKKTTVTWVHRERAHGRWDVNRQQRKDAWALGR
ncbi:hypothetical protein TIFTF001_037837 [Ficus carica]|uniref:Uncharacterized protein n=1 Tax=Ficus carica TaxID=3494 RepID=A0AA88CMJ4_FICCA|nr:hypothetical protein TIFTF001_050462 [Ficus carica]GMN68785.1 hypothetical protein TIFTF001_037837 [Ficus carica]